MGKDYYQILGVSKDADETQIKKAFRKLAMIHHPDKNPNDRKTAEAKFKDIAEAYEVLSDKQKRAIFDQYGEEGLKGQPPPDRPSPTGAGPGGMPQGFQSFSFGPGGGGFGGFKPRDANDIFSQFFSQFGGRGGGMSFGDDEDGANGGGGGGFPGMFSFMQGGGGGPGGQGRGGTRGTGSPPQPARKTKGAPVVHRLSLSLEDLYTGVTKKMKITRTRLEAGKPVKQSKVVEIQVRPGWKEGTKITFEGDGDESPGVLPGDIVFTIDEQKHSRLIRSGDNLIFRKSISVGEGLLGTKFDVQTLDGKTITVDCTGQVTGAPNFQKVIANKGMPKSKSPGQYGHLVCEFDVQWPTELTTRQKQLVREANI